MSNLVREEEHIIGLFADEVICYLEDPDKCLPILTNQLQMFGFCSGYTLNLTKTQVLIINYHPSKNIQQIYHLNWSSKKIDYFGVTLTSGIDKLYKANYTKVDQDIRNDIERWTVLPLDLSSRVEIIKMNLLPRLLYLFQSLPVDIPDKQFRIWDKIISRFIWNGKRPRVKFETL